MKDALRNDRARIQVGRISHFGLLEMSRQRIRTSVLESSTDKCPHCGGSGHMRSVSSVALQLLRAIEETMLKGATHNQIVRTRPEIAQYVLNNKRAHLMALEQRFRISIVVNADATVSGQPGFTIERGEQVMTPDQAKAIAAQALAAAPPQIIEEEEPDFIAEEVEDEEIVEERGNVVEHDDAESQDDEQHADRQPSDELGEDGQPRDGVRRRRRRRRGRGSGERPPQGEHQPFAAGHDDAPAGETAGGYEQPAMSEDGEPAGFAPQPHGDANGEQRHRRRGRRGGRRNRRGREPNGDAAHPGNGNGEQFRSDFHRDDAGQEMSSQPFAQPSDEHSEPQPQPSYEPPREPSFAPPAPPPPAPEPVQEQPAAPEPRRRSTVREPAPVFSGDSVIPPAPPPPMPEPVPVVTSASDDANKPRRTGWWAKRLLGGDKT
jgi:ribonuclease E